MVFHLTISHYGELTVSLVRRHVHAVSHRAVSNISYIICDGPTEGSPCPALMTGSISSDLPRNTILR